MIAIAVALSANRAAADDPGGPVFAQPILTVSESDSRVAVSSLALSPDGARLAYIAVARKAIPKPGSLRVISLPGGAQEAVIPEAPHDVDGLHWVARDHVVLFERVGRRVRVHSAPIAGPMLATQIGPVDRAAVVTEGGSTRVVTYAKARRGGVVEHEIVAYEPTTLKEIQRTRLVERKVIDHPDGRITPLWWERGSTVLVGRRVGPYDEAKDIRLPHQLVRLDVFGNTVDVAELPVEDFARVSAEHRVRPGSRAFVFVHRKAFKLVTETMRAIVLARAPNAYYAGSLHHQDLPDGRLLFSATSKRARKDPSGVELYVVDLASGEPKQLLVADARRSLVEWHASGERLALLRKRLHARTAPAIDVYALPTK